MIARGLAADVAIRRVLGTSVRVFAPLRLANVAGDRMILAQMLAARLASMNPASIARDLPAYGAFVDALRAEFQIAESASEHVTITYPCVLLLILRA